MEPGNVNESRLRNKKELSRPEPQCQKCKGAFGKLEFQNAAMIEFPEKISKCSTLTEEVAFLHCGLSAPFRANRAKAPCNGQNVQLIVS